MCFYPWITYVTELLMPMLHNSCGKKYVIVIHNYSSQLLVINYCHFPVPSNMFQSIISILIAGLMYYLNNDEQDCG